MLQITSKGRRISLDITSNGCENFGTVDKHFVMMTSIVETVVETSSVFDIVTLC